MDTSVDNTKGEVPRHVAIIMDGNGRWAANKLMGRVRGHIAGVNAVRKVVRYAHDIGVRYLTLYAFSSENWNRPKKEVSALMKLMKYNLLNEAEELARNGVRIRMMGAAQSLPAGAFEAAMEAERITRDAEDMQLLLAISYGGRQEILDAAKSLVKEGLRPEDITEEAFRSRLYLPDVPDPDLVIRTSGEFRISNFLIWQLAYSELYVTDVLWPDFNEDEFQKALDVYAGRERRFGKTSEQLTGKSQ